MSLADPTLAQQLKNIAGDSESITLISEFSKERRPSLSSGINVFQICKIVNAFVKETQYNSVCEQYYSSYLPGIVLSSMEQIHKDILRKNRPYLVSELMIDVIWPHLAARDVFNDEMIDIIKSTNAPSSQIQRMLNFLPRRGPNAYHDFLECLNDTEQSHIVDHLNEFEEKLRAKEPNFIEVRQPVAVPTAQPVSVPNASSMRPANRLQFSASPHNQPSLNNNNTQMQPGGRNSPSRITTNYQSATHPTHLSQSSTQQRMTNESQPTNEPKTNGKLVTLNDEISSPPTNGDTVSLSSLPAYWANRTGNTGNRRVMSFSSPFTHNGVPLAERSAPVAHVTGSVNSSSTTDGLAVTDAEDELLIEKGAERSSLGAMFRSPPRSSVTSTDTGGETIECIQTTDHPNSIEVNALPEQFGIPQTAGRMDFDLNSYSMDAPINPNWDSMYKMTSQPRGYCLIINNRYFMGHLKERLGTDVDRDNLYRLYSQLGYQICIQENLTGMEMLYTLRDFSQLDLHRKGDSCVVVLLTHGLDGQLYGTDAKLINISEIFGFFDGNVCPGLKGKPKFFLVQACRGESYDSGFDLPDNGQAGTVGPASQVILDMQNQEITEINKLSQKLPSLSDFLIAYATVPGFVSWRNSEQGSWFVQALCEVFSRKCRHDDAVSMLVEVNNKVASIYESATKHKQMPSPVVLLRKKLYFFPLVTI